MINAVVTKKLVCNLYPHAPKSQERLQEGPAHKMSRANFKNYPPQAKEDDYFLLYTQHDTTSLQRHVVVLVT